MGSMHDSRNGSSTRRADGALIPIGVLAKRTGCIVDTIRFYEKIGVLPKPRRTESGHRVYGAAQIARLTFIRRTRDLGFSLDEVRGLLKLAEGEERTCDEVEKAAIRHRKDVRRKIADLRIVDATLGELIKQCQVGEPAECPLIKALSQPKAAAV